jgi:hypothetical protein
MRMRVFWMAIAMAVLTMSVRGAYAQQPMSAGQLVREVIYNELTDHHSHGFWRYWVEHHSGKETRLEDQVETAEGPVTRLARIDGLPLSAESEQEDQARMQHLLASPEEQAKHRQEYQDDEARIGRILELLPDAYVYEYDGEENGCYRLRFQPNPGYSSHSIEARVFHSMSGTLWVNARYKRLARLDGKVEENLDFGYGLLGRLDKGGWFQLVRAQVSPTDWKTERLEVHMTGRALLFKSFAQEKSETRGGFLPVPAGIGLAQGMALLDRDPGRSQQAGKDQRPIAEATIPARAPLLTPEAFALGH